MTKQEFIAREKELATALRRRGVIWLVVFFGLVACCIPLSDYCQRHGTELITNLVGVGLFVVLCSSIPFLVWQIKRQQRLFGVHCPKCGKPLIGIISMIAVATGNCGRCGEKVFDEPSARTESKG